jgi:SAM-dependent methyltransferase
LNVVEGDACNLDFPDSSFDAAVMNFGMLHLEAPDRAIEEALRVLRPEGRFAFTVWDIPERAVGFGIILNAIQAHGKSDIALPPGPPFFRFGDAQESRRTLEAAGFVSVEVRQLPLIWRLSDPEDLFTAFLTAGVRTTALLRAQTADAKERIRRETIQQVERFRTSSGIAIPTPCVLTAAQKPRQTK